MVSAGSAISEAISDAPGGSSRHTTLEIRLLGQVSARSGRANGSQPHRLGSRRARVAFALLTLERQRGVTRDALADAVWDDRLPPTWPSALRSVISGVRNFILTAVPDMPDPIVGAAGRYLLRLPAGTEIDLEEADRAVVAAGAALDAGEFADARRLAAGAVDVLSAPFLPDHDGEWVASVRSHIAELLLRALETVSRAAVAVGDPAAALAAANEAVMRAPLRESAHRSRMAAHAAAGNRSEALRSYQQLRSVLADELGVDPSPETEATYLDLLGPAPRSQSSRRPLTGQEPRPGSTELPRFVGRAAELTAIAEAWNGATTGSRQVVVLTGEPGVGKTRLVSEAARRIMAEGGMALFGWCDRSSPLPHQPFVEMLDGYLAATPPSELPALSPQTWDALAASVPSLAGRASRATPAPSRAALFDAVTSIVKQAAIGRPVLAVLDDLQWADPDTLLLLQHLLRHTDDCRLLVVAVSRGVPGRRHPLTDVIAALRGSSGLHRLHLGLLPARDVRELVHQVRPVTDDGSAISPASLADASGNPLLLLELLRWSEPGVGGGAYAGPIPPRVQDLVASMVDSLDRPAAELVRAASVSTGSFEVDLVRQAAGLSEDDTIDALEAAQASGLIVEVDADDPPHRYRFAHNLIRCTVHGQLSSARRRLLHHRWADAIEGLQAGDVTSHLPELAHHRLAGAATGGDRRAVRCARLAASLAAERRAHAEASRLLRQALPHVPRHDDELRAEVLTDLGRVQALAGDGACEQTLVEGVVSARRCGRIDLAAQGALALADLASTRPELHGEVVALLRDLLGGMGGIGDVGRMGGAVDGVGGAVDELMQARLIARLVELDDVDPVPIEVDVTGAVTQLSHRLGALEGPRHLAERAALAHELAAVGRAAKDPLAVLTAAHHAAMVEALGGRDGSPSAPRALESLAQAVAACRSDAGRALLAEHAVAVAVTDGRFDDAMTIAETVDGRGPGDERHLISAPAYPPGVMAVHQLLVAHWLRGLAWRPKAASGNANLRRDDKDENVDDGLYQAEHVLIALLEGDRGRARLAAHALAEGVESLSVTDAGLHTLGLLALVAAELGDPPLAVTVTERLTPYADLTCGVGYRTFVGTARLHLGRLAVVTGDWAEAERHLTAAVGQLADLGARPWLALAHHALATVLAARRRPSDLPWITTLRADARATAHHLGLRLLD